MKSAEAICSKAGFTLVELLVVLVIVSVSMIVIASTIIKPPTQLVVKAAGWRLMSALRSTRSFAIRTDSEAELDVDLDKNIVSSPIYGAPIGPRDIQVHATVAKVKQYSPALFGIMFFPDGSSTGGSISLRVKTSEIRISVNWLTGQARMEP